MRVVFAGTPEVAVPALETIAASAHDLAGVVTRPDAPAGRGRKLVASPVAQKAEELGVPLLKPEHPKDPEFQDQLASLDPDCCPVVAYGALLPQSALDIPRRGWVNLHFSLLPAWRGAAPVQHAIWSGDDITGATTFRIVKELDAGPMFGVVTERIRPTDTAGDLLTRLAHSGAGLLVATLDGIEDGSLVAREQPSDGVSFAPKIQVEDAEVDWTEPAPAVDRRIRACTPGPGAWSTYDGERIKLGPDCCPVVAYGALLPQSALDIPEHGWVNLHFSLLPAWRGAAPVQHAIWAGDEITGATTFRIVKELDAGPTFGVVTETVRPTDTAGDLLTRLAHSGAGLLVATLDGIEDGSIEARDQPSEGVSFAPKILVEDAEIDWAEPAIAVDRRIRACTPGPGAWSTYSGERVKIAPVALAEGRDRLAPGVLEVTKHAVFVGTGTDPVQLGEVRAFGKKQMQAADWARGVRLGSGEILGG